MSQKNAAIIADKLTKRYGDLLAVDGISFHVDEGEIFGFLGPNGSGKTSTIRMLVGLTQPSGGRASVLGCHLPGDIYLARRYVGVVPDISNLYDELSARENLLFSPKRKPPKTFPKRTAVMLSGASSSLSRVPSLSSKLITTASAAVVLNIMVMARRPGTSSAKSPGLRR